jgi:hypothetical protein
MMDGFADFEGVMRDATRVRCHSTACRAALGVCRCAGRVSMSVEAAWLDVDSCSNDVTLSNSSWTNSRKKWASWRCTSSQKFSGGRRSPSRCKRCASVVRFAWRRRMCSDRSLLGAVRAVVGAIRAFGVEIAPRGAAGGSAARAAGQHRRAERPRDAAGDDVRRGQGADAARPGGAEQGPDREAGGVSGVACARLLVASA